MPTALTSQEMQRKMLNFVRNIFVVKIDQSVLSSSSQPDLQVLQVLLTKELI